MSSPTFERFHEQMERWRNDPVNWVRRVMRVEPTAQQAKILTSYAKPGSKTSVTSGHGIGKSTALAWAILHHVSLFFPSKTPCTAPTAHQLKDILWAEVGAWRSKMHPWFKDQLEITSDRLWVKGHEETQFAVARTARPENPEALQGFHADHLLFVVDEASGVVDAVYQPMEGALSTQGARAILASNPTQTSGYFFQTQNRNKHLWTCFQFSSLESPLVDEKYGREMAEKYGEDSDIYKVRVLGGFPNASINQLIPRNVVEDARKRKMREDQFRFAPIVLGVDVAWEGDDRSACFMRQGLHSQLLGQWRNVDNITLAGLIAQFEDRHRADAVFVDVGWGTGVIDCLRSLKRNPIPINFGGSPIGGEYVNKRTEMWCLLREWLAEGGQIPDNQDLEEDLVGPQYFFTMKGKRELEAKRDMKKRGLPSPDLADALALTFAAPVYKRAEVERVSPWARKPGCQTEYDVLRS